MKYFLENFRKDIRGVLWWALGLLVALSLWSYHPEDPSFSSTGGFDKIIKNYCGYFGSFLADLLYQFIGFLSWVFPLACFHLGFKNFSQQRFYKEQKKPTFNILKFFLAFIFISCLSALFTLYFPDLKFKGHQITVGGFWGLILSQGLTNIFNFIGASLILWAMTLMVWVLYTEKPLLDTLSWPFYLIFWFLKRVYSFSQNLSEVIVSFFASVFSYFKNYFYDLKSKFQENKVRKEGKKESFKPLSLFSYFQKNVKKLLRFKLSSSHDLKSHLKDKKNYPLKKEAFFFPIEGFEKKESEKNLKADQIHTLQMEEDNLGDEVKLVNGEKSRESEGKNVKPSVLKLTWKHPTPSLFKNFSLNPKHKIDEKEINEKAFLLKEKLQKFGIGGEVIGYRTGPAVTLFEFKPQAHVKISRITDLADDLSLALSSESVRIIAPIPGRNVVGIETANIKREMVSFKELLLSSYRVREEMKLPIILGLRADGTKRFIDLRKMPHMMVAGSTGSGKSSFILSAITSLLFFHSPQTLRFILIDPKQVDLMNFASLPHLLMQPIRTPQKALEALKWVLTEMEDRYQAMSKVGAKTLEAFNEIVKSKSLAHSNQNSKEKRSSSLFPQPYIVVVIEEFSDLMSVDRAPVEQAVIKLAQMARACGIHLILAMQSPRRDVITGLIKTNIPGRISFKVASKLDSRIILDESGAERLLNCGDMLFLSPGLSQPERCHAPWVEEQDIKKLIHFWKKQAEILSVSPKPIFESRLTT